MKNIWRIFKTDMKHLFNNSITVIIVIGLVFLPSIFTWYNVIACWDAFGNTGNLTVAVANTDEGYESDLVPLEINVGDQVVSALRANDQLNWTFTSEEDAIDGAQSGRYYAAVVIPKSFSRDMMTFYSDEVEHASIIYYANEKKNAIAPKVTDQGADQVSNQVNQVFLETLSDVALSIVSSLSKYSQDADLSGAVGTLADHVDNMAGQMMGAASVLGMYSQLIDSSQSLISQSGTLLGQARDEASNVGDIAKDSGATVSDIASALSTSADSLSQAIDASAESYKGISAQISDVYDSTGELTDDTAQHLRNQAAVVETEIGDLNSIISALEGIQGSIDAQYVPLVESMVSQLKQTVSLLEQLTDSLYKAADGIQAGYGDAVTQRAEIQELADKAANSLNDVKTDYNDNIKPGLDELSASVSGMVSTLQDSAAKLNSASRDLSGDADSVATKLSDAKTKLANAQTELTSTASELTTLSGNLRSALASGNVEKLREVIGSNPAVLASAITTPVALDRHALFPADNFGSQMAPLYTTLSLWIGSLLMMVAIKPAVSKRGLAELDNPKPRELYFGRYCVVAVLSLLQTTCVGLGNMLFLGVQVSHPLLFMVCFWVSGLVYSLFIYTLVLAFANLGKAIAVLFLILQVTAGGGAYPLQVLPEFFQIASPFMPATHTINAMRAAMMGIYNGDFFTEMGMLLLFVLPSLLLGLVLRKPLEGFMGWFVEKVEESKMMA
ncbi:YhgE/Pip domain-containing protein [uncultured Ellagibacter sp.]|uniref:YhgE/Pip domain-containing protein n=1 Tax=uncultured Ellagibacter sp. TaxID=2137580 RepID=UPI00262C5C6F|nr:YhgE/Pip domain-containing protein [uncultured Ellagibacter sp.]